MDEYNPELKVNTYIDQEVLQGTSDPSRRGDCFGDVLNSNSCWLDFFWQFNYYLALTSFKSPAVSRVNIWLKKESSLS